MPDLLVVDDDEALRRWEERVLGDQGYSCDGACDASSARAPETRLIQARAARRQHAGRVRHGAALPHSQRASRGGGHDGHRRGQHRARDGGDRARRLRLPGQAGRVGRAAHQRGQRAAPPAPRAENRRLVERLQATSRSAAIRWRTRCRTSSSPRPRFGSPRPKRSSGWRVWSSSATRRPDTTCSA